MEDFEAPPSYAVDSEDSLPNSVAGAQSDAPPAYAPLNSFVIGKRRTGPLVSASNLKGHLSLLRVFHDLRDAVVSGLDPRLPAWSIQIDPDTRWAWFVGLAVERFEKWSLLTPSYPPAVFVTENLPPVDVLMVFHTYLLNPGWFTEDTARFPPLRNLSRLSEAFKTSILPLANVLESDPSDGRIQSWCQLTGMAFDPFDSARELTHRDISCPNCQAVVSIPLFTPAGTGYLQKLGGINCPSCDLEITKEKLAVGKFIDNAVKMAGSLDVCFAGTVYSPIDKTDARRGQMLKLRMLSAPALAKPFKQVDTAVWRARIVKNVNWSMQTVHEALSAKVEHNQGRLLKRIISAYFDDKVFSFDLVGAVLRQASFVQKMCDLEWTKAGFFDSPEDELVLEHAIARYHAFLDLMTVSPQLFLVPTLDIDLVWHTHQLMNAQYHEDCWKFMNQYVDHHDKVEENHLSTAFDLTCRAWQERFRVPYVYCGCPLPGKTIGAKMRRLSVKYNKAMVASLQPPNNDKLSTSSHPSDHNAVYVLNNVPSEKARQQRVEKDARRRERDMKDSRRVMVNWPFPAWSRRDHPGAFLLPIPMFAQDSIAAPNVVGEGHGPSACGVGGSACSAGGCHSGGGCGAAVLCGGGVGTGSVGMGFGGSTGAAASMTAF